MTVVLLAVAASAGTWRLEEELVVQVRPPVPVGWLDSTTRSEWLVAWTAGEPTFTATLCGFEVEPMMGAVTSWSEAAVAAVPPLTRPVSFDGARFVGGPVVETVGATDEDGDGNPGISVHVAHPRAGEGEVFVRQTATIAWDGVLGEDGVVRGTVVYEPEQEMLGATTWWLRMGITQRAHRKLPSTFTLTPIGAEEGCRS